MRPLSTASGKENCVITLVSLRGRIWLGLLMIYFTWGSLYLAIRFVVDESPPMIAMAIRFGIAALAMATYVLVRGGPRRLRISRRELAGTVGLGALLLGIGNGFNALGISLGVPTGLTALLCATVPLFITAFRALSGQRITPLGLLAVAAGLAGVAYLMAGRGQTSAETVPLIGVILVLGAAFGWALGSFLQPQVWRPADLVVSTTYQLFGATGFLLLLAVITRERPADVDLGVRGWAGLAYLIVIGSVISFTVFQWLLRHASVSLVATHTYVNPVVAVALGAIVLSERIGPAVIIGGGVVVLAVVLTVLAESSGRSDSASHAHRSAHRRRPRARRVGDDRVDKR